MEKCITNTRACVLITELIFVGAIEGDAEQSTAGGACDDEEDDRIGNPGMSDFVELCWWVCETTVKQFVKELRNKTHPQLLLYFFYYTNISAKDAETSSAWRKGDVENWFCVTQGDAETSSVWRKRDNETRLSDTDGEMYNEHERLHLNYWIDFCGSDWRGCGTVHHRRSLRRRGGWPDREPRNERFCGAMMMSLRNDSEAICEGIAEQNPPTLAFIFFLQHQYFCERCWNKFSMTKGG